MSHDMRRFHKLMKKIEPLAATLQEAGIREFDATFAAACLVHSRPRDRFESCKSLFTEVHPLMLVCLRARLESFECFHEAELSDLERRAIAALRQIVSLG
jgi:hypothetical protein